MLTGLPRRITDTDLLDFRGSEDQPLHQEEAEACESIEGQREENRLPESSSRPIAPFDHPEFRPFESVCPAMLPPVY